MEKLRIGVLGCANIADRMVIPAILSMKQWELVAVSSRSAEKARKFAEKFNCLPENSYDALLSRTDIDAVYIPLPNSMHTQWAIRALNKGKHCLVEKPLACDLVSAKAVVESARQNQLSLFENFMFLYHSQQQFIREKLDDKTIGDVRCFRCSFGFPPLPENNFRWKKDMGGGALLDAGGYLLKACQLILGETSPLTIKSSFLKMDPGKGIDLYGGAFLSNEDGAFAQIAFGFDNFYQCNYEIWGSKGKITAHRAFTAGPGVKPLVVIEKQDEYHEYFLPADNHFVNILNAFYRSIVQKESDREDEYNRILHQAELIQEVLDHAEKK